jgi:hypothetical protein
MILLNCYAASNFTIKTVLAVMAQVLSEARIGASVGRMGISHHRR